MRKDAIHNALAYVHYWESRDCGPERKSRIELVNNLPDALKLEPDELAVLKYALNVD